MGRLRQAHRRQASVEALYVRQRVGRRGAVIGHRPVDLRHKRRPLHIGWVHGECMVSGACCSVVTGLGLIFGNKLFVNSLQRTHKASYHHHPNTGTHHHHLCIPQHHTITAHPYHHPNTVRPITSASPHNELAELQLDSDRLICGCGNKVSVQVSP